MKIGEQAEIVLGVIETTPRTISFEAILDRLELYPGELASILCGLSAKKQIFSPRLGYFKSIQSSDT